MTESNEEPRAQGWYDDPEGRKGVERYWNGSAWSGAPRQKPPQLTLSSIVLMIVGTVLLSSLVWWLIFT